MVESSLTFVLFGSPGVCVMNIDNGFGAAAFAYKCIQSGRKVDGVAS